MEYGDESTLCKWSWSNRESVNGISSLPILQACLWTPRHLCSPLPQQLKVPLTISSWKGIAILDTGSSYTLVNEQLWNSIRPSEAKLNPCTGIPLYLANGKPEHPLGWTDVEICLHGKTWSIPMVVLSPQALAFSVVLGLDFVFFSGKRR